jgi:hypothetical protein
MMRLLFFSTLCLLLAADYVEGKTETETETETEVYLPRRKLAGIKTDETPKHDLVRGRNLTGLKKRPSKSRSMKMEGGTPESENQCDANPKKFTSTGTLGLEGDKDDLVDEQGCGRGCQHFL